MTWENSLIRNVRGEQFFWLEERGRVGGKGEEWVKNENESEHVVLGRRILCSVPTHSC